jgi:hypothetical protein
LQGICRNGRWILISMKVILSQHWSLAFELPIMWLDIEGVLNVFDSYFKMKKRRTWSTFEWMKAEWVMPVFWLGKVGRHWIVWFWMDCNGRITTNEIRNYKFNVSHRNRYAGMNVICWFLWKGFDIDYLVFHLVEVSFCWRFDWVQFSSL